MIQRIQSIWLLLAAAASAASLKLPFFYGTKNVLETEYPLTGTENFSLIALTISIIVLSLVAIFLYKNRRLQLRLGLLALLFELLLLFLYFQESNIFLKGTMALTSLLQIFVLLFLFLAARGIRADEKIISDSEKLR